jgi:hypothetical protein
VPVQFHCEKYGRVAVICRAQHFVAGRDILTPTSNVVLAAIQEASLQAQIAARESIITANAKMLGYPAQPV